MKNKIFLIGVLLMPVLLMSVEAADIFGNWIVRMPEGEEQSRGIIGHKEPTELFERAIAIRETVFSFKAEGTKLTGKVSDAQGESAIRDGKINGDEISFVVIRNPGGKERKLIYKGKVGLNEIKFTVEAQNGTIPPVEFIAKREFQRNQDIPLRLSEPVPVPVPPPPRR